MDAVTCVTITGYRRSVSVEVSPRGHMTTALWEFTSYINKLGLRQNGCYFADKILQMHFLDDNFWILTKISIKFVLRSLVDKMLVQIMAWCQRLYGLLKHIWNVEWQIFSCYFGYIDITRPRIESLNKSLTWRGGHDDHSSLFSFWLQLWLSLLKLEVQPLAGDDHGECLFMPAPLGAGGIMFSGCPSVRPSEAWNTLFWPVHRSVGPPDQPLPFYGMSVRPSVCPSVRLSVRPSVRRGFLAFAGDCIEGLAWNFTCWCILTIFRTDKFMVTVWWFFKFWRFLDLVKRVKFGVSGYFPENAWRKWPEILHADVSWPPSVLISLWLWSGDFSNFGAFWT